MLHLTTGGNGAGKTLFTLKDVRERQLKENRPVYYNGRFKLTSPDFGWIEIDIKDWESCPDGSIFFVDECHNDFPTRKSGSDVPQYVKMLAEHRRRGMDFYLITQHPGNIDVFVRRLIASPGWHRHLKRTFGANLVSQLEWASVNTDCEKAGSGASGTVTTRPFPKEVYGWYESAMLHTGKKKIPFPVYVLGAVLLAVPVLGYLAWGTVGKTSITKAAPPPGSAPPAQSAPAPDKRPMTTAEMVATYIPRFPGLPHTAPRYDEVTKPVTAPLPSACIATASRCECYTQQGTRLDTPDDICRQVVKHGYFVDFAQGQAQARPMQAGPAPALPPGQRSPAPVPEIIATAPPMDRQVHPIIGDMAPAQRDGEMLAMMRARR